MVKNITKQPFKKHINVKLATNPGKVVINGIVIFNIILFVVSALILKSFKIPGAEDMNFLESAFYVMRLILSANMDYTIAGPHVVGVGIFTIVVSLLGAIFFTGSLIAYLTNYIAKYMGYKNPAMKKLYLYNHIVILGWNVRATEIIRNLLFTGKKHEVIVLANVDRERIENEIEDAVGDALYARNTKLKQLLKPLPFFERVIKYNREKLRNRLTIMIKTGETYSSQQLKSVSLCRADAVIILGEDVNNLIAEDVNGERYNEEYGNSQILKTTAQVANIAASEKSLDGQIIVVEVDDPVTLDLVAKIIKDKEESKKCKIIPMPVAYTMGSLISQFSLNPEMGPIYNELLSQYGLTFSAKDTDIVDSVEYARDYFKTHTSTLPLVSVTSNGKQYGFYIGEAGVKDEKQFVNYNPIPLNIKSVEKTAYNDIIFFGENAQFKQVLSSIDITLGSKGTRNRILIINPKYKSAEKYEMKNSDVTRVYTSEKLPKETYDDIINFIRDAKNPVTFVLLSNNFLDIAHADDETIATLVRIRELQGLIEKEHPDIDGTKIKVVVELLDPKHHDVIKSFDVHNVIISNRLTSKMITQFAFESSLYGLYLEMLVKNAKAGSSKNSLLNNQMYSMKVSEIFEKIPENITAFDLVRSIFEQTLNNGKYVIVIGIIDKMGKITLFDEHQMEINPNLDKDAQLIMYKI